MLTITDSQVDTWFREIDNNLIEMKKKKDGMERAAKNHNYMLALFRSLAFTLSANFPKVSMNDIHKLAKLRGIEYDRGPWLGSVFTSKDWTWKGEVVQSDQPGRHCGLIKVWERRK